MTRRLSLALAACMAVLFATPAAGAEVGVSVNIGHPGFYGRIDIGTFAPPPVIYAQPIVIAPAPVAIVQRPIYLRVPPGHARDWARHCGRYSACGQRTYFVEEDWYRTVYVPARGHHHHEVRHRHAPRHAYRDDRHYGHRSDERGHARGHGRGHDHGHYRGHGNGKSKGKSRD